MAKRKMFKDLTNAHLENLGSSGNWNLFATIDKQQAQIVSAYLEKVRLSYVLSTIPSGDEHPSDSGIMFCASIQDTLDSGVASNNDGKIISAAAGRLIGGTVVLDVRRSIKSNAEEVGRADGPIYLFVRNTGGSNTTSVILTAESFGRYIDVTMA